MPSRLLSARHVVVAALAITGSVALPGCNRSAKQAAPVAEINISSSFTEAQQHLDAAKKLANEGQHAAAVDEYTAALAAMRTQANALQDHSLDADVLFQRGVAYLNMGFPDTAAADFTVVLRLRSDDGEAYARRGECYAKLGDLYKAVRDCTDAIRFKPESANAYRYRGQAYSGRGQFERSVADFEKSLTLDPTLEPEVRPLMAKAYCNWSLQLENAGNQAEADAKLAQARELDPTLVANAATGPATGSDEAIELTVAKQVIDEAREKYEQGVTLLADRRYDDALTAFTAAIKARPDYADALLKRGETLMAMGFPDTAVKDFELAVHFGKDSIEAYRQQAEAFLQLGSPHRTVLSATDALHVDPTDAQSYALRGRAYVNLGNWDRGLADLEEAIRRDPALAKDLQPALERARAQREAKQASDAAAPAAAT